jgi:hypothetical protein
MYNNKSISIFLNLRIVIGCSGDVIPLLALARTLSTHAKHVVLITHAELEPVVTSHLGPEVTLGPLVRSRCFRRPIVPTDRRHIPGAGAPLTTVPSATYAGNDVEDAAAGWDEAAERRRLEYHDVLEACLSLDVHMLIINLFATIAVSVAEYLSVPLAVASPYFIPYPPPAIFERNLREQNSSLWTSLKIRAPATLLSSQRPVDWSDVEHWLWSPYTDRDQQEFRDQSLFLHPLLLHAEHEVLSELPPAPPVLYGLPIDVFACPAHFPDSASFSTFWTLPVPNSVEMATQHAKLASFLASAAPVPVPVAEEFARESLGHAMVRNAATLAVDAVDRWPVIYVGFGRYALLVYNSSIWFIIVQCWILILPR